MTEQVKSVRKLSISVPPDVAARLDQEANVSAFVTDTLRARIRREEYDAILAERGMTLTPEGLARAAERRLAAGQPSSAYPQIRDRIRRELDTQRQADQRGRQAPAA
jgi:post-segregation antitoxin (ccd killing protein)